MQKNGVLAALPPFETVCTQSNIKIPAGVRCEPICMYRLLFASEILAWRAVVADIYPAFFAGSRAVAIVGYARA